MMLPQDREEKEKLLKELLFLDYEKCDRDFASYFRSAWLVLEPSTKLLYNWHHDLIAEYLTACYLRQIKRLIINIPPRYGKSNLVSVTWPTWVWTKYPQERFIFTSYSASLSTKHSTDRRTLIESAWYRFRWGCRCKDDEHDQNCNAFRMATDQNVKTEFQNDRRGHMIATSMGGSATGKGGNILVVDDPHDTTRAESQIKRESDILEFDQKFTTRLDDKENGVIIIVMQRLHENDLTGHCLEQGGWDHIKLEAEATKKTVIDFPCSSKQFVREEGSIIHAARENADILRQTKKALGTYGYLGQYQQSPTPREGGIFKRKYWQRYDKIPQKFDEVIDVWDFNFKDLVTADNVCGQVWGRIGADKYLLHMVLEPKGFIDCLNSMAKFRKLFPAINRTIIEDKANGPAIIQVAKKKIAGLIPFNPQASKEERAAAVEPQLEAGNVYLPVPALATYDVDALIDNFAKFPKAKHDDDVDALTMALLYFGNSVEPFFV